MTVGSVIRNSVDESPPEYDPLIEFRPEMTSVGSDVRLPA
jgi:hypothetical protein